jgi:hypothetical protein
MLPSPVQPFPGPHTRLGPVASGATVQVPKPGKIHPLTFDVGQSNNGVLQARRLPFDQRLYLMRHAGQWNPCSWLNSAQLQTPEALVQAPSRGINGRTMPPCLLSLRILANLVVLALDHHSRSTKEHSLKVA